MSFERLVDQVLRRPWRQKNDRQEEPAALRPEQSQNPYSNQHQYSNTQNQYVYPEHDRELPEYIRHENASHYNTQRRHHGLETKQNPTKTKKHGILGWIGTKILNYLRPKKRNVPKYKRPPRPWYWAIIVFFSYWSFIGAIWVTLGLVVAVTIYALISPDPLKAGLQNKPAYISIVAGNGKVIAEKGLRRNHVKLEEMPPHMVNAVLATEDWRFYYHPGLDPIGIIRATYKNRKAGRIVQGGSTITQQLAKVLFLKPTKSYWRKVEEMLLSFWLEYRFSKKQILELYLNRIYFGAGNYGVEAAAQHYFGKSVSNVTVFEAAILAGLIKSPSYYAPTRNLERSKNRAKIVLKTMYNGWFLSRKQYQQALLNPPELRSYLPSESYGYVIDWVVERASTHGQNIQGDMIVQTTIDYELQGTAQRIVKENIAQHGEKYNAQQGALVILDMNGGVRALVGGKNYRKSKFNRIVKAKRQPGSTFKPFVFLAAMERGYRPDTLVKDSPIRIGDWQPKNYSNRYYGDVTMRIALAKSLNTVSVKLSENVGRKNVIQTAHRLGINTKLHSNPSIALGTSEVSPLEITGAYTTFANGGFAVRPHIIKRITSKNGKTLYENKIANWGRVVNTRYVAAMNDMLTATVIAGTAKQAAIDPHQVAGKTGTGQGYRDAWFIGYTAHYVGGVWIGNDNFKPMNESTGGALPAMIWRDVMQYAHLDKRPQALPGGNWKHQLADWSEPTPHRNENNQGRGFFNSLFGNDSIFTNSNKRETVGQRKTRQQQEKEFNDIFDAD